MHLYKCITIIEAYLIVLRILLGEIYYQDVLKIVLANKQISAVGSKADGLN
jgi:hypothetical protein